MSTIYTDGAGNKYLGDCVWAAHDISYPSTKYLKGVTNGLTMAYYAEWRDDFKSLLTNAGYTSMSWDTSTGSSPPSSTTQIFQATFPSGGYYRWTAQGVFGNFATNLNGVITGTQSSAYHPFQTGGGNYGADYAISVSNNSIAMQFWTNTIFTPYNYVRSNYTGYPSFCYAGILQDVNTNYSYYTPYNNKIVFLRLTSNSSPSVAQNNATLSINSVDFSHYIASAKKSLLQTGRAVYTIACSDGQTPAAQWATDMWVYDNNATLGYPVIGRVPNMLLGIGSYTYLKPVKIIGSVFPDGGSPWYLPVGTFSGKALLMRCYSSMT